MVGLAKAVFVFTVAALVAAHAAAQAVAQCPTTPLKLANGVQVDLSQLPTTKLLNQQQIRDGTAGSYFDWDVNFCSKTPECAGDTVKQGTYFIAQYTTGSSACSNALFSQMTVAPAVSTTAPNTITISYVDVTGLRIANVFLTCGDATQPLQSATNQFMLSLNSATAVTTFTFNWQSAALCASAAPASNGLSWGGVYLILFFVGLFLYAAAAVGFNYYKGMRGKDLAPHPDFWKSLPSLFLDGVKFTAAKVLALCGKGDGSFTPSAGAASGSSGAAGYSAI